MAETPRLKEKYTKEIVAKLEKELGVSNVNQVPRLEKIVVNMGVGAAAADSKASRRRYERHAHHHGPAALRHACA